MKYKIIFLSLLILGLIVTVSPVLAEDYGLEATAKEAHLTQYGSDLSVIIGKVIGTVLSLIGVIFFALMIYGGFLWMTAHGKEEQAKEGLNTVIAAVIGIFIILAAYAITSFVFKSVGGGKSNPPLAEVGSCTDPKGGISCTDNTNKSDCEAAGFTFSTKTCEELAGE